MCITTCSFAYVSQQIDSQTKKNITIATYDIAQNSHNLITILPDHRIITVGTLSNLGVLPIGIKVLTNKDIVLHVYHNNLVQGKKVAADFHYNSIQTVLMWLSCSMLISWTSEHTFLNMLRGISKWEYLSQNKYGEMVTDFCDSANNYIIQNIRMVQDIGIRIAGAGALGGLLGLIKTYYNNKKIDQNITRYELSNSMYAPASQEATNMVVFIDNNKLTQEPLRIIVKNPEGQILTHFSLHINQNTDDQEEFPIADIPSV